MSDFTTTKLCPKCKIEKPATTEYFNRNKSKKDGFAEWCKVCRSEYGKANPPNRAEYHREWWKKNAERVTEYKRQKYQANHEIELEKQRKYREVNRERIRENNRRYEENNREKVTESKKRYREANRGKKAEYYQANHERFSERGKQYRENNREKIKEYHRQYRLVNKDKIAETNRKYRQAKPEIKRINHQRRKARKRQLADTFTHEQWQYAIEYFNGRCAVCGCQLRDLFGDVIPHADHWIPLSHPNCPGTTADNMLPLCSVCNLAKKAIYPNEWLVDKFGSRKANQILKRIEVYFKSVREATSPI